MTGSRNLKIIINLFSDFSCIEGGTIKDGGAIHAACRYRKHGTYGG